MGTAFQRGARQAAADVNYFRAGINALVGNEQRARTLVQKGIKDASEAENTIGSLSMAKEWERFLDEPSFEQFWKRDLEEKNANNNGHKYLLCNLRFHLKSAFPHRKARHRFLFQLLM